MKINDLITELKNRYEKGQLKNSDNLFNLLVILEDAETNFWIW
jgi:hypothetical protein